MPHPPLATPSSLGVPERALLDLLDDLERGGTDPHALVVARHGEIVLSTAWRPWTTDGASLVYSVSKTVTALAVGLLVGEGRVSLDDAVGPHLGVADPHGLTVRHLLAMSTGHDREQTLAMPLSVAALLTTPPRHAPGSHFAYSSPASFALSALVTRLTGERVGELVAPRVLAPLGIGARWWRPAHDLGLDLDQGYSGLHLTATDVARLALLVAERGRHGDRQLVPAEFTDAMTHEITPAPLESVPLSDNGEPDTAGDWGLGYGLHVWPSRYGFRLDGAYGQLGVAVPERGLTIGYLGASTDVQRTLDAFWRLLGALRDEPLEVDVEAERALEVRTASLDSWDARDLLAPGEPLDVTGWELRDSDADGDGLGDGWLLTQPTGDDVDSSAHEIAVATGAWSRALLPRGDRVLVVATRGERLTDGSVRAHLVVPTSPHRLLLQRDAAGLLTAHWHTAPLWDASPWTLTVPTEVARPAPAP